MTRMISKTNETLAFFNDRLDQVRMSGHERLAAKARLAQSEAIADAVFAFIDYAKRQVKSVTARPLRRPTISAG